MAAQGKEWSQKSPLPVLLYLRSQTSPRWFFSVTVAWFYCLQSTFLPLVKENFTEVYCLEYTCLSSTELNDSHGHSLLCATQDGLLTEAIQTATAAKWHHRVGTTEPIQNGQR